MRPPLILPERRVTALLSLPFRQAHLCSEIPLSGGGIGSQLVAFPFPKPALALLTIYGVNCSPPVKNA
jgi:hypothetical protein